MDLQRIGPYRIVRKLGEGGMGAVYEAVHDEIARSVAIKVLRAGDAGDPDYTARLLNEARAVNIIRHRSIVGISDLGRLPDGSPYIVMDYLDGETLRIAVRRGLPPQVRLRLARQIASALAAVHAKGIIHRDLKPDNVIVIEDPEVPGGQRAIVLDFGIAKLATEHKHPETVDHQTDTRITVGTATYMSPEQAVLERDITDRTDVYSFGIMLYELLTGAPPFTASTYALLLDMHRFSAPIPLTRLDPTIDPRLAELVTAMLAKRAPERPSMVEVAASLEAMLSPSPSAPAEPPPESDTAPKLRKGRETEPTPLLTCDDLPTQHPEDPSLSSRPTIEVGEESLARAASALMSASETIPIPKMMDPERTPAIGRPSSPTVPTMPRPSPEEIAAMALAEAKTVVSNPDVSRPRRRRKHRERDLNHSGSRRGRVLRLTIGIWQLALGLAALLLIIYVLIALR